MGGKKVSISRWVGRRSEGTGGWEEGVNKQVGGAKD